MDSPFVLRTALILPLLAAVPLGCSGGARPASGELEALVVEAAALDYYTKPPANPTAREAVRDALRRMLELDHAFSDACWKRMSRPELQSYFLHPHAYIGGKFPQGSAELLREVQELEGDYLTELGRFPELLAEILARSEVVPGDRQSLVDEFAGPVAQRWQPIVAAVEAHRTFVDAAAALYELVAAQPESIQWKRKGLEFADAALEEEFGAQATRVDEAHEKAQRAYKALDTQHGGGLHWMGQTKQAGR